MYVSIPDDLTDVIDVPEELYSDYESGYGVYLEINGEVTFEIG